MTPSNAAVNNAPFFVENEIIVLNKEGVWIADGVEITHEPTRRLFAKSLHQDADGWYLHVGRETKRITVEDTPFFVHGLEGDAATGYTLRLSDETREALELDQLHYRPGRLTVTLARGHEAKFLRGPYFELLKNVEEDDHSYWLEAGGAKVKLASKG
jgi:hypothetical protein